jgi:Domain of unknown function (DUF5615)
LDANLSYRVAAALATVHLPFIHVSRVPGMESDVVGRSPTPDEVIAKWCATAKRVLVTCDEDFRGRWVRSGLLKKHGVEVIVFEKELAGLDEQHHRITMHYPWWQSTLGKHKPAHRVWLQGSRRSPREQKAEVR